MEEGREDWVSSTAGFKRNRKRGIEWMIVALRREEGKLGLYGVSGKRQAEEDALNLRKVYRS